MVDYSRKYRAKHLQNQIDIAKRLQGAMARIGDKVARLASDPQAKFVKSFDFRNNPHLNKVLTAITAELQGEVLSITEAAIATSWAISNQKNDITVNTYFEGLTGLKKKPADYLTTNSEALRAFINRKNGTGTLSDSVWKVADSFRDEMEVHLGYGIANGDSAQVISRRIREYLNNPEQLFRRVRNEAGKLGLSENAKQFHPGQGTYRSAYKNALRVSRSETNQAYLLNDHLRWKKMDFVIGVHIELSEQHPVTDICDSMQGDYPKDFVFVGFHSQCLCHATPIIMPKEKFKKYLAGEPVEVNEVVDVPQGHKDWIEANKQRVEGWKSKPYFIRDNYKDGDLNKGFVFKVPKVSGPIESITIPAPIPKPKPVVFTPARTIQEAESRILSSGVKSVSLKGLKPAQFNAVLESIESESKLGSFSLDKLETYRKSSSYAKALFSPSNNSISLNLSYINNHEVQILKSYQDQIVELNVMKNNFQQYLGKPEYKQTTVRSRINSVNNRIFDIERKISNGETARFHSVSSSIESVSESLKATVFHELGHYRQFKTIGQNKYFSFNKAKSISEYGRTDSGEYFAEWYSQYRMFGEKDIPEDLLKLFKSF